MHKYFSRKTSQHRQPIFPLFVGFFVFIFSLALTTEWGNAQSPNLVSNPIIAGKNLWTFLNGATYDSTVSQRTDGSGSIKMGTEGSRIMTKTISVIPGKQYIYSASMKHNGITPGTARLFIQVRTSAGTFKRNVFPAPQETPATNTWYKSSVIFTPNPNEFSVQLYAVRQPGNGTQRSKALWLDNMFFQEQTAPTTAAETDPSTNLVNNTIIAGKDSWYFMNGASYDPTVSRKADGSGSVKLGVEGARALTEPISVVPGKKYTYSVYMKDQGTRPGLVEMFVQVRTNAGTFKRNAVGSRQGVPEKNKWYESSVVFIPKADEFSVQLFANRQVGQSPGKHNIIWIDDVYFGEGIGFAENPTPKKAFNGSITRVDARGNIEVFSGNSWEPFFPLCVYADGRRPDWSLYSTQGFNCNIWAGSAGQVQKAKNATSSFNPNGMMSGFEVSAFTYEKGWAYKDWNKLRSRLSEIKNAGLMNQVLMYFWDNENEYDEWTNFVTAFDIIKQADTNSQGKRMHPIYGLQGNHGISRIYSNNTVRMTDIVGTYATNHNGGFGASPAGLVVQNNSQGQDNPVVFTQLNYGVGSDMRSVIYEALIDGAKGVGFWRDTYNSQLRPGVEHLPWWHDLPNLRHEIDQLGPLLRESHDTTWSVTHQEGIDIEVGTRMHQGKGHVILVNKTQFSKTVTFTINGLPYTASKVQDYFSEQQITSVSNKTFRVTIPGKGIDKGTAVYRLTN